MIAMMSRGQVRKLQLVGCRLGNEVIPCLTAAIKETRGRLSFSLTMSKRFQSHGLTHLFRICADYEKIRLAFSLRPCSELAFSLALALSFFSEIHSLQIARDANRVPDDLQRISVKRKERNSSKCQIPLSKIPSVLPLSLSLSLTLALSILPSYTQAHAQFYSYFFYISIVLIDFVFFPPFFAKKFYPISFCPLPAFTFNFPCTSTHGRKYFIKNKIINRKSVFLFFYFILFTIVIFYCTFFIINLYKVRLKYLLLYLNPR
jgi:hypothetical protein